MYNGQLFKDIPKSSYNLTSFPVYKEWSFNSQSYYDNGIGIHDGFTSSHWNINNEPINSDGTYKYSIRSLAKYIYNENPNANNELTQSHVKLITIPPELFGEKVKPGSIRIDYGTAPSYTLYDDSEHNLKDESDTTIGYISYKSGNIIITDNTHVNNDISSSIDLFQFRSSWTIYEHEILCEINKGEFNCTLNNSAFSGYTSGSSGRIISGSGYMKGELSGSLWDPYITTIGLYNDNLDLLAIGRFANPIKNDKDLDLLMSITLDE